MDSLIGFNIEYQKKIYPTYSSGFLSVLEESEYLILSIKVSFLDGTVIKKKSGVWIYKEECYDDISNLLDNLPEKVIKTILFNMETFRGL